MLLDFSDRTRIGTGISKLISCCALWYFFYCSMCCPANIYHVTNFVCQPRGIAIWVSTKKDIKARNRIKTLTIEKKKLVRIQFTPGIVLFDHVTCKVLLTRSTNHLVVSFSSVYTRKSPAPTGPGSCVCP